MESREREKDRKGVSKKRERQREREKEVFFSSLELEISFQLGCRQTRGKNNAEERTHGNGSHGHK